MPEGSEETLKNRWRQYVRRYMTRDMFYALMAGFVILAGFSIGAIPPLRHRFTSRVFALRAALVGEKKPLAAQVGQKQEPLPPEFQRPAPAAPTPMQLPPLDRIFTAEKGTPMRPSGSHSPLSATRILHTPGKVARGEAPDTLQAETTEPGPPGPANDSSSGSEIKYQKGATEQQAYDLLLKTNPKVAGLVQGSNPSLRFKSWDVARRGDDTYWVRLKFQSNGDPDEEYIWQVQIQANKVTPLSYNARSVS